MSSVREGTGARGKEGGGEGGCHQVRCGQHSRHAGMRAIDQPLHLIFWLPLCVTLQCWM